MKNMYIKRYKTGNIYKLTISEDDLFNGIGSVQVENEVSMKTFWMKVSELLSDDWIFGELSFEDYIEMRNNLINKEPDKEIKPIVKSQMEDYLL